MLEIDVRPVRVHDFLFSHPGHEEELKPQALLVITGFEQSVEFFLFVDLRFLFCVPGPVVLPD